MPARVLHGCRWYVIYFLLIFVATLMPPQVAHAQALELNGGWAHIFSNNGTDGVQAGVAWWFNRRLSLAANYDSAWDTSSLTTFAPSSAGLIAMHSYMQNALVGPRFFFTNSWTDKHRLNPFVEVQFGESWLDQQISVPDRPDTSANSHAFSWMLGGGAEYLIDSHWSARVNLGLLRSHLAEQGQSQMRFVTGITYTVGRRGQQ